MFTGIITATQKVQRTARRGGGLVVRIGKPSGWKLTRGESVAVDGICSTVAGIGANYFEVEYMPETLAKTTASRFTKGDVVNLERSLRVGARLGGHLVQGHVDAVGEIQKVQRAGSSRVFTIRYPVHLRKFIAPKGSVAVNGMSLTMVKMGKNWFTVSLVRYTLQHTNLGILASGAKVNIEVDVFARYLLGNPVA
jgi:riboflavin synthase